MNLLDELKALIAKHADAGPVLSDLECRHELVVALADHRELPSWARWEVGGVSYQMVKDNKTVWGYMNWYSIVDAVIDRRIRKAFERNNEDMLRP